MDDKMRLENLHQLNEKLSKAKEEKNVFEKLEKLHKNSFSQVECLLKIFYKKLITIKTSKLETIKNSQKTQESFIFLEYLSNLLQELTGLPLCIIKAVRCWFVNSYHWQKFVLEEKRKFREFIREEKIIQLKLFLIALKKLVAYLRIIIAMLLIIGMEQMNTTTERLLYSFNMKVIEFLKNKLPLEWKTDLDSRSCELFQKHSSNLKASLILLGDAISMIWATFQIAFDNFISSDDDLNHSYLLN